MKTVLIVVSIIFSFYLFVWCVFAPWFYCDNYSFKDLNFPKEYNSYKLPHGFTLLYNKNILKYKIQIQDEPDMLDYKTSLRVYSDMGMNNDLWTCVLNSDETTFSDSGIAKYYAFLYINKGKKKSITDNFKPLTK